MSFPKKANSMAYLYPCPTLVFLFFDFFPDSGENYKLAFCLGNDQVIYGAYGQYLDTTGWSRALSGKRSLFLSSISSLSEFKKLPEVNMLCHDLIFDRI